MTALSPRLKDYATKRQAEVIQAVIDTGSISKAAKSLNINRSSVQDAVNGVKKRAALQGFAPDDQVDHVSAPFVVERKTIQYGAEGNVEKTWLKTKQDKEDAARAIEAWVAWLMEDAKGQAPKIKAPKVALSDQLAIYPMGDPHFGMYSWGKETGQPFDLEIAESVTKQAMERLVSCAPATETALLIELGDFFHMDNSFNRTPKSGNTLDVDTRWQRVVQIGLRTMIYCIKLLLVKHKNVIVRFVKGNHDPQSSVALALAIDAYFHDEKRLTVELTPNPYWYYRFGKVLIGATHGDACKSEMLPGIMASDRPVDWGLTEYRYFYHGHIHHDKQGNLRKDYPGVEVESFRTLAAKDAWAHEAGYRAPRDMKVIVMHKDYGEWERHRVDIAMLEKVK